MVTVLVVLVAKVVHNSLPLLNDTEGTRLNILHVSQTVSIERDNLSNLRSLKVSRVNRQSLKDVEDTFDYLW